MRKLALDPRLSSAYSTRLVPEDKGNIVKRKSRPNFRKAHSPLKQKTNPVTSEKPAIHYRLYRRRHPSRFRTLAGPRSHLRGGSRRSTRRKMESDYGAPRELSGLQQHRALYRPELPPCLQVSALSLVPPFFAFVAASWFSGDSDHEGGLCRWVWCVFGCSLFDLFPVRDFGFSFSVSRRVCAATFRSVGRNCGGRILIGGLVGESRVLSELR